MKQTSYVKSSESTSEVCAFITKNKQRLKQFNSSVYLDDKQEFEIEIFNPLQTHVLSKIKLNGEYINGGGIVLRPGERVFLERFLDTNNKFVFNTYNVDNSPAALNAISNNGKVSVEFYKEIINLNSYVCNPPVFRTYQNLYFCSQNTNHPYDSHLTTFTAGNENYRATVGTVSFSGNLTTNNISCSSLNVENKNSNVSKQIETGIVDKGKESSQSFTSSNRDFSIFAFKTVECQILPLSQKVYTTNDIKQYCTECGAKITKSSFKFCPICGNKI